LFAVGRLEEPVEVAVRYKTQLDHGLGVPVEACALEDEAFGAVQLDSPAEVVSVGVGCNHVGDAEVVCVVQVLPLEVHVHNDAPGSQVDGPGGFFQRSLGLSISQSHF